MLRDLAILACVSLGLAFVTAPALASQLDSSTEFRDTVKPETVPAALARQGKISVQPWTDDEKSEMRGYLQIVFERVPGLFRLGSSQGPIPLYRIDLGSSFGGHGALWFSYMNVAVVAHELTHVADAEHKIARSQEFRSLVVTAQVALRH